MLDTLQQRLLELLGKEEGAHTQHKCILHPQNKQISADTIVHHIHPESAQLIAKHGKSVERQTTSM